MLKLELLGRQNVAEAGYEAEEDIESRMILKLELLCRQNVAEADTYRSRTKLKLKIMRTEKQEIVEGESVNLTGSDLNCCIVITDLELADFRAPQDELHRGRSHAGILPGRAGSPTTGRKAGCDGLMSCSMSCGQSDVHREPTGMRGWSSGTHQERYIGVVPRRAWAVEPMS